MSTSQGPHSWSKEFKKRRHAFEQPSRVGPEGGSASPSPGFEEEGVSEAQTGPREGVGAQDCSGEVPLRRINSPSTPTAPKPRSMTSWSPASGPHPLSPSLSSRSGQPRRHSSEIDGQREDESEDDDSLAPLGIGSGVANRRSRSTMANSSAQRVLAIGEETGQKERMIPYGETTSPGFSSQSQSDDSEREDGALTHQIALLTVKNNSLQKQLNERELERDRLREQLELQRQERNSRTPYSPTGLPSRLLDGRKVLRDSISGLATGSGGPTPISPSPSAHSPTTHSPRFRTPPGGASGGTVDPGRKGFLDTFAAELMASAERVQMENSLKRKNADLERHLREVTEEKKYLEHELQKQKEAFAKMQVREQDLSKDIEILRDENSHHTGAINKLKTERDGLQTENDTLHEELHAVSEKLNKIEKCYKEVEHENVSLDAEIDQLMSDKKQLFEEKQNLQAAVEDALKTKENYRSTIKQLREQNRVLEEQTPGVRKPVAPKPDKRRGPETKVQQTLGEVMTLREEKTELQGKILSAQKEIDSLKADLQAQETQEHTLDDFCGEVTAHLLEFQDRMVMMNKDLTTTKTTISTLLGQQKTLVHDSFMLLAEKCKEQLSAAQVDRSKAETALKASQKSLQAMESDYQTLKSENTKLQAKRSTITSDVSKLRSEIAALQDQKRLLSVQLSQHETLAQEKDERMTELETQHKQLQDKLTSSEKRWKNEYVRLERDWEGKLAEANLTEELLSEEKESLLNQQAALEQKLDQLQLENKQLTIAKTELEAQVGNWEAKIEHLTSQVDKNDSQISSAQQEVARLLAERAVITAKMTFTQQSYEERFQALKCEHSSAMESASLQSKELQESLDSMKAERAKLSDQFALVSEKETQIDRLTSQMAILTQEKEQMKVEMGLLNEKYTSAQQQFQSLAEAEQTRLLNNEKLKLTLKTEIELLKSRLNSVNDEKHKLEDKMLKLMAEKADSTSAFQAVPQSKQVEQLKKQIAALQVESKQHRKFNQQESSNRVQLVDLQTRLASLEVENKRLREAARNSTDAIDATASLRKQVSEMSRKTFFLESEKKSLTEKVHSMQISLKVARDTKDRMATDQVLKLQEQNQALQERIRNLERMLTTKWMAAEQKIVSTVEENDKLRQRLLQVQETITSHQQQGTVLTSLIESLKSESELLSRMKDNLESSRAEFEQLETKQERVQALQTEIQQLLSSSGGRSTTPTPRVGGGGGGGGVSSTNSLPPVLKSLPPGYLSSLQGSKRSASPSDSSRPLSPSSSVVQEKLTQMQTVSCEFGDGLEKHQKMLKEQESELEQLKKRFAAIKERLTEASSKSSEADHLDPTASVEGIELRPDQVQTIAILQKQNETLQDQVIDRDVALQDIELQMKKDYEMHDRKFALLKSQVLELREQLSDKDNQLRAKDQYIQQTEERCLEAQNQLFKAHKEMERVLKEREQLVTKGIPENLQLQGITSVADALRVQGEELCQLQKALNEFTFDVTQLQSQLDSVHREKSVLQSKQIEMERMHIQMKEAMSADIDYLRKLNLQLVEQHMKAEKATEILREVKGAQEAFRKQKDLQKLETELESCNLKLHEQSRTISDFERQVASQALTIKLLQAGKQHSVLMTQHTKELTNQIGPRPAGYLRPRSAESARRPNYRISDFKSRTNIAASVLQEGEFSIPFPVQNSSVGSRVDILNLEEQPEDSGANLMLSLGPMVVTDDEYSSTLHEEKASKPQRVQKLRNRGHRRTASTGSNVLPYVKEKETVPTQHATTLPHSHPHSSSSKQKPIPKYPKRPGSAGSTRTDVDVSHDQAPEMKSPDQIVQSAQVVSEYMNALNNDLSKEGKSQQQLHSQQQHNQQQQQQGSKESTEKSGKDQKSSSGMRSGRAFSQGASNFAMKIKHKYSEIRSKQANKSTDSNETTSSHEGGSGTTSCAAKSDSNLDKQSKSSSKESTAESANTATVPPQSSKVNSNQSDVSNLKPEKLAAKDLNRTESMSSTCSTLSLFSHLPSRNPSFSVYDGGESSPYSHESLEIGDSVENLQAFTKLGYNPYLMPIHLHHNSKHDTTTSSSDEDMSHHDYGRLGRRKRSSGATNTDQSHDTPRHKDASDNSNSSCDSDQLQRSDPNYHGKSDVHQRGGIPVHRNESISISDMEKYATDVEIDQKAVDLQQRFGRVRYSSTGSVKICYSESSNTSMEDVSKN